MESNRSSILFLLFIASAATFIWSSSDGLPSWVACHFGAEGAADGYMPRLFYVWFMLVFVFGFPTVMTLMTWRAIGNPKTRINLPHQEYWLAPERRSETIAFLRAGVLGFSILLMVFLCFAHWLIVLANKTQPAHLPGTWFLGGLGSFFVAVSIWSTLFLGHFRSRV